MGINMAFPKRIRRIAVWTFLPGLLVCLTWGGIALYERFQVQVEGSVAILPSPVRPSPSLGGTVPLNEARRLKAFVSYLSSDSVYQKLYHQLKAQAFAKRLPVPDYGQFSIRYQVSETEPYTVQCRVKQEGESDPASAVALTRLGLAYLPHAYRTLFDPVPPSTTEFVKARWVQTQNKWQQVVKTLQAYQEKTGALDIELRQALAHQTFYLLKALLGDQVREGQHLHGRSKSLLHALGYRKKAEAYLAARFSRKSSKTLQNVSQSQASSSPSNLFPATNPPPKNPHRLTSAQLALVNELMRTDREIQAVNQRVHQMQVLLKRSVPADAARVQEVVEKLHTLEHEKIVLEQTQVGWQTEATHQQFLQAWGLQDEILAKDLPHVLEGIADRFDLWVSILLGAMLLGSVLAVMTEPASHGLPAVKTPIETLEEVVREDIQVKAPEDLEDLIPSMLHHIRLELPALEAEESFLTQLNSPNKTALGSFQALLDSLFVSTGSLAVNVPSSSRCRIALSGSPSISAGLAVAMARQGEKVCLLELEGKTSQLLSLFFLDLLPGLSDLFQNQMTLDSLLQQAREDSPVEHLTVLTLGNAQPLSETQQVRQLQSLLEVLDKRFDRVLLHSSEEVSFGKQPLVAWLQPDQWLFCCEKAPKAKAIDPLQLILPSCQFHWIQPQ